MSIAYVVTHTAAVVPTPNLGAAHEDVTFTTSDGLRLEGWFIPSRNGATVIAFPGRSGPQKHTRLLVKHGYGVLLFDRRGEGASEGDPNTFGWVGDRDLHAAIDYLRSRRDVDPERIGAIGLSVGRRNADPRRRALGRVEGGRLRRRERAVDPRSLRKHERAGRDHGLRPRDGRDRPLQPAPCRRPP